MTRYFIDYDGNDTTAVTEETDNIIKHITSAVHELYAKGIYHVGSVDSTALIGPGNEPDYQRVRYAQNDAGVVWSDRHGLDWQHYDVYIADLETADDQAR